MNTSQHTSLTLSKLIHERVPELETEKWHWWDKVGGTYRGMHAESPNNPKGGWEYAPAYTFTDCLRAIQMLGEKQVKEAMTNMRAIDTTARQHDLLHAYLSDSLTIGENTERYLTSLFTE
jgi:hypothetical protein